MLAFFNQYSLLIVSLGLIVVAGLILLTNKPKWNDYLAFGVIVVGLFVTWNVLRPRETPLMDNARTVTALIGAGTPVLLEFQSPYCIACAQIQPAVDQLEAELDAEISIGKQLHIVRLNVQDDVGRELAAAYDFEFTPTFILFDSQGNEMWRSVGTFDPQMVRDSLQ
jgi:thiol-disulfide isomerase/thioredoxin